MSKFKLTIFIIIIISIAIGVASGFYFYTRKPTEILQPTTTDKSIFGGIGGVRTDLPTDNTNNTESQSQQTSEIDKPTSTTTPEAPILRKIAQGPIAGANFVIRDIVSTSTLNIPTTSTTSTSTKSKKTVVKSIKPKILGQEEKIRYIESGTGKVYETSSSTTNTTRVTNSTFTRLFEVFFNKNGDNLLVRGLLNNSDIIQTRLGTIALEKPTSTEMSLQMNDLPYNQLSLTPSPERDYFAFYTEQKGIGSSINISRLDGTGLINIYKSPFREWLLSWPIKDVVILNTKPSAYSNGFAYSVNTKTKAFKRITGGQNGLTTLMSPDGQNVLVGESVEGSTRLSVLNLKTNSFKDLYIRTLPEKCIWSNLEKNTLFCAAGESIVYAPYPDAWYQGLVFFDDNIWKINTETQENKLLVTSKDFIKDGLDITNIYTNKNEDYLLFTNKKDLSLWGLKIEKPQKTVATPTLKTTKTSASKATSSKTTNPSSSKATTTASSTPFLII